MDIAGDEGLETAGETTAGESGLDTAGDEGLEAVGDTTAGEPGLDAAGEAGLTSAVLLPGREEGCEPAPAGGPSLKLPVREAALLVLASPSAPACSCPGLGSRPASCTPSSTAASLPPFPSSSRRDPEAPSAVASAAATSAASPSVSV